MLRKNSKPNLCMTPATIPATFLWECYTLTSMKLGWQRWNLAERYIFNLIVPKPISTWHVRNWRRETMKPPWPSSRKRLNYTEVALEQVSEFTKHTLLP